MFGEGKDKCPEGFYSRMGKVDKRRESGKAIDC